MTGQKMGQSSLFDRPVDQGNIGTPTPTEVNGGMEVAEMSRNQVVLVEKVTRANIERLVQDAEALVEFSKRIRKIALKNTSDNDWCIFGDKVYPLESCVKKTLQLIGASIRNIQVEEEIHHEKVKRATKDGQVYDDTEFKIGYFTAIGEIHFNGRVSSNVGTASTKDQFFAVRGKSQDGSVSIYLDYDEVDKNNVKKKAVTNLCYRLLEMVLKLNPTIAELAEQSIKPTGKVSFGSGTKGGTTDSKGEAEKRMELKNALAKASADSGKSQGEILTELTKFDNFKGYYTPDKVSTKMLSRTVEKLKDWYGKNVTGE